MVDTNETPVENAYSQSFNKHCVPTIEERDEDFVPAKFKFNEPSVCPLFTGIMHILRKFASGVPKIKGRWDL